MRPLRLSDLPIEAFESLLRGVFDGVAISDAGHLLYVNQRFASMFGYTRSEMLGMDPLALLTPESQEAVRASMGSTGEQSYFAIALHRDGARFHVEIRSVPFYWKGRVLRIGAIRDISDQKGTGKRLRDAEIRFQTIIESAEEGIWQMDQNYNTVFVNAKMANLLGYTAAEMVGRPLLSFISEEARAAMRTRMEGRRRGTREQYEFPYLRKDGAKVWMLNSAAPLFDEEGAFQGALGLFTDVTERRRADEALRESNELFQSTFEQAAVGVTHNAPNGQWLRINRRFCEILGYAPEELLAKHFVDFILPEDRYETAEAHRRVLAGETSSVNREMRLIRKDGALVWVQVTSSLLRDPNGAPKYFVAITQDISEKKDAEDKLLDHRMRMFASSKMSALGEMASGMAHEINNPLSVIRSHAHLLRDSVERGTFTPEKVLLSVEKIDQTVVRISAIVRSMMGYARDSDRDPFRAISVKELIHDTLELCEARLRQGKIDVKCVLPSPDFLIECRKVPISQVILNLLNNAVDAMEGMPEKRIRIIVLDQGEIVEFSVEDNGCGVAEESRLKIMQPFFTTKSDQQGTGLGLSVSRKIADAHLGTLTLDYTAENTRFVLRLPKKQPL